MSDYKVIADGAGFEARKGDLFLRDVHPATVHNSLDKTLYGLLYSVEMDGTVRLWRGSGSHIVLVGKGLEYEDQENGILLKGAKLGERDAAGEVYITGLGVFRRPNGLQIGGSAAGGVLQEDMNEIIEGGITFERDDALNPHTTKEQVENLQELADKRAKAQAANPGAGSAVAGAGGTVTDAANAQAFGGETPGRAAESAASSAKGEANSASKSISQRSSGGTDTALNK